MFKWFRGTDKFYKYGSSRKNQFAIDKKLVWKEKLSMLYAFFAFNSFLGVIYACTRGKIDWADYYGLNSEEEMNTPSGRSWANTLGIKNATVIKVSGLTKTGEYYIDNSIINTEKPKIDVKGILNDE